MPNPNSAIRASRMAPAMTWRRRRSSGVVGAAGRTDHLADQLALVFWLGQVHPALRRVLHDCRVVGDRPGVGDARPELPHGDRFRNVVGGIGRRVVHEHVGEFEHQAAIGMIDHVSK